MIKKIKQKYRNGRQKQLDKFYISQLEKKTTSYDSWIRRREEKETYENPLTGNIVVEKEYCIFVEKKENLSDLAERELEVLFQSRKEVVVIYSDEDEINSNGKIRMNPRLKPDFSPDTLLSYFYFGGLVAVRKSALKELLPQIETSSTHILEMEEIGRKKLYQVMLKLCLSLEKSRIYHCRKILYTSHNTLYWGFEQQYEKIKQEAYESRPKAEGEGVSIIIPSKDNPEVLRRCLKSIKKYTKEVLYEIILVDNGSSLENKNNILKMQEEVDFTYLYHPMEFNFSKMCNMGAAKAKNSFLLFLNDDCEVRNFFWLNRLQKQARVKETGAVGVKLYYPESRKIQHCGIYHIHMGPAHKLQFKEDNAIYYDRRNKDVRNVTAVTAACLMVRKEVFDQVNGFDEQMKVAFNDVDLCYRIYEAGYYNVVDNENYLWHHESLSRGSDDSEEKQNRFRGEKLRLYEKHPKLWKEDPYYHPDFTTDILDIDYSLAYEYDKEQFQIVKPWEIKELPGKLREDSCVAPLIEYVGELQDWFLHKEQVKKLEERLGFEEAAYVQGSMVVIGSDNAIYEKYMVFCQEELRKYYQIRLPSCYRPDVFRNLPDQKNVALSGFSCFLDLRDMEPGKYYLYAMVKDKISGQYILKKTQRWIERKNKQKERTKVHDREFPSDKL